MRNMETVQDLSVSLDFIKHQILAADSEIKELDQELSIVQKQNDGIKIYPDFSTRLQAVSETYTSLQNVIDGYKQKPATYEKQSEVITTNNTDNVLMIRLKQGEG